MDKEFLFAPCEAHAVTDFEACTNKRIQHSRTLFNACLLGKGMLVKSFNLNPCHDPNTTHL